tara:strand:+ start:6199 stop:6846 length:648 start_codon:yes stop_codon:yes gene_type:complete
MSGSTSVFVADDHPLVLRGLLDLIQSDPKLTMVGSCGDGISALSSLRKIRPDIAVLDNKMPELTGLEVLAALQSDPDRPRVILLTAEISDQHVFEALQMKVDGLVLKSSAPETLIDCLHQVSAGHLWLPEDFVWPANAREEARRRVAMLFKDQLTQRERQIVKLALQGQSNKEIARDLNIAEGTVKIHLNNVYNKLGTTTRASLADVLGTYLDLL